MIDFDVLGGRSSLAAHWWWLWAGGFCLIVVGFRFKLEQNCIGTSQYDPRGLLGRSVGNSGGLRDRFGPMLGTPPAQGKRFRGPKMEPMWRHVYRDMVTHGPHVALFITSVGLPIGILS